MVTNQTVIDKITELEQERKVAWSGDPTMSKLDTIQTMERVFYQSEVLESLLVSERNIYYVSTTGNDANIGTIDKPFRTIKRGVSVTVPGDTVIIRGGVYKEILEIRDKVGNAEDPFVIQAYTGEDVTVDSPDWACFDIRGCMYLSIDRLKCTGGTSDGVFVSNSNNCIFRRLEVFGNSGVGIHLSSGSGGCSDNLVINCDVHDNGQEGVYIDVKTANPAQMLDNTIEDCHIKNNGYEGIQNTNQGGTLPRPERTVIRNNIVETNNTTGDWAEMDLSGNGLVVEDNTVYNTRSPAGGIYCSNGVGININVNTITNAYVGKPYADAIVLSNVDNSAITNNHTISKVGISKTGVNQINGCSGNVLTGNTKVPA